MSQRRGNRTTEELRREFRQLSPEQRFERQLRMSRTALRLREAGRRARA
ncbi:MAG: hypothetical protein ACR2G3_07610 [Solirubrobacterales bacterium]